MKKEHPVTKALIKWYKKEHRDLPWRTDPTPYHVWLSEIMLQQTRVEAVKGYYARFLDAVPDIAALAEADEEKLLKLWEGLGYYSRVRNMQKAARVIMEAYGGEMPHEAAELKKLPGIGDYTAAAVASIAFGKREAVVDGNVLRVMARLLEDDRDIALAETKRAVQAEIAASYLPEAKRVAHRKTAGDGLPEEDARCGTFNQSLMELGAVICVPNGAPLCDTCPVYAFCEAGRHGTWDSYPVKSAKKARRIEQKTVLLLCDRTRVAIRKRPAKGLLAGLYEYPLVDGHLTEQRLRKLLKEEKVPALRIRRLEDAKHIFTHIEWHMRGYLVETEELSTAPHKPPRGASAPGASKRTRVRSTGVPAIPGEAGGSYELPRTLIFADRTDIDRVYAIPSAFRVYTNVVKQMLPPS